MLSSAGAESHIPVSSRELPCVSLLCLPLIYWVFWAETILCGLMLNTDHSGCVLFWGGLANPVSKDGCSSQFTQATAKNIDQLQRIWRGPLNPSQREAFAKGRGWNWLCTARSVSVMVYRGIIGMPLQERPLHAARSPEVLIRRLCSCPLFFEGCSRPCCDTCELTNKQASRLL